MNIINDLKWQYKSGGFEQKLIFWNIAVYLVSLVFFYNFKMGKFYYPDYIGLSSDPGTLFSRIWTLFTYSFFHGGFFHLLVNMIMLNFSGRLFLTFFTQRQFIGLYFLSGIFAGLVFVLGYLVIGKANILVGASGAIMAVLVASATYSPMMNLRLLLIGNVRLWQMTAVFVFLFLIYMFVENTGGHIAHLAGALFGFGFIKLLQNGIDLSKGVFFIFDGFGTIFTKKKTPFRKVHRNSANVRSNTNTKTVTKDKAQQQIDEILDKISRSGYDSLTKDEKDFLFRAGKQ